MTRERLIGLAGLGSALILLTGFGFQYLGGLAPCELCLWQRWPHAIAPVLALLAVFTGGRLMPLAGMLTMFGSCGLGIYHTGVERHWWPGPSSCTGDAGGLQAMSGADLLNFDATVPVVLCDQVAWQMFGLSMASYNALASVVLAGLWLRAVLLTRR
ncbi:MAG: disulfide bond formation protein B [Rhodobacteraceae bacterium]|nr:disulfide bond formation protein B [Paracoccaceae bacterium]